MQACRACCGAGALEQGDGVDDGNSARAALLGNDDVATPPDARGDAVCRRRRLGSSANDDDLAASIEQIAEARREVDVNRYDTGAIGGKSAAYYDEDEYDSNGNLLPPRRRPFNWRVFWSFTGPGWLMSIAYLDPGNIESDLQAGAFGGYQLIWVLFLSTAIGLVLQCLAARLGTVTGKNLAEMCHLSYSRPVSVTLWIMTEIAIIGSDIQEVVGSAIAFRILFGWPLYVGVLVTGLDTFTFLFLHYFGVRKLEAFFAALIFTMCVCFFADFGYAAPPAGAVAKGFLPYVKSYAAVQAVGILGAVIMPHNIYLHSALVQSRKVDRSRRGRVAEANFYFALEAAVALGVSFLINLAVVACFAASFFEEKECATYAGTLVLTHRPGGATETISPPFACFPLTSGGALNPTTPITCRGGTGTCQKVGLETADVALEGLLGSKAKVVWAIGLLAAGQSSTMTGTYAGQFVMEGFMRWKIKPWQRVGLTRLVALGPAITAALAGQTSSSVADSLDEWLNVLQSVQLPFALLPLIHFTSSKGLMGSFANGRWIRWTCWPIIVGILVINIVLVVQFCQDPNGPIKGSAGAQAAVGVVGAAYFGFIGLVAWDDLRTLASALGLCGPPATAAEAGGGPGPGGVPGGIEEELPKKEEPGENVATRNEENCNNGCCSPDVQQRLLVVT